MIAAVMADGGRNASLTTLNLSDNKLIDDHVESLAAAIAKHPTIRKVSLQNCRMSDKAFANLAAYIPKFAENFKHLLVDGTQQVPRNAGRSVRKTLLDALLKNVHLKELAVPYRLESDALTWALEFNRAGRRALLLKGTTTTTSTCGSRTSSTSSTNTNTNTNTTNANTKTSSADENTVAVVDYTNCATTMDGDDTILPDNDMAIECTSAEGSAPFVDSRRSASHVSNAVWPVVYERADRVARQTYCHLNERESSDSKSASAVYLLLRERGYQCLLR